MGEKFAGHKAVSHCYERPIFADWPYSVYTMLHCRGDDELRAVLDKLADISGFCDHVVLRSVKEYKKTRVRYFMGDR